MHRRGRWTEQEAAEAAGGALGESERRFRQLFENSADALFVMHPETREVVDCNREACRSLRYPREELLALRLEDFACEVLSEEEKRRRGSDTPWRRALAGEPGTIIGFHENTHHRKDGTTFPVEVGMGSIDYKGRRMILASCRDVTERKRFEEALRESEKRLRSLVEQAADAIFVHDLEGKLVDVNRRACESLGYAREELLALSVAGVEQSLETRGFARIWERAISGEPVTVEGVHRRKDGTTFSVEVRVGLFEAGRRCLILAVARDVTGRKEAEEALRESEARFRALFEQSSNALFVHDYTGQMVDCNLEACRSLGYAQEDLLALSVEDFGLKLISDEEGLDEGGMLWERVMAAEPGTVAGVVLGMHQRKDGTTFPVEVRLSGVDYGGRRLILASCRDLTERRTLEGRLAHQAFHDSLTGLPNRALFADRLEHALARAERRGGKVAVLFLDLDNFKYVNDSLGHDAGDRLLAAAAGRLEGCVRPGDTVARLGGDEFAVLLEEVGDAGEATRVARRAVEALSGLFDLGGREVFVGTSVGIALGEAGRERPDDLLRKADMALYEAKRGGKARYALFDPEAERRSVRRLELENGLRRAIERDEFRVCYQPVVSLKTGRIAGFEALIRWEHPERGLVHPGEFIPLAEENGLIVPIGRLVLRDACRHAKEWQGVCPAGSPPAVSVNLSARQLSHPDLVGVVEGALDEAGLDPGRLILEVTESVLVEDEGRHADTLRELRELGVRFAIDDFGTGYSSLSYLRRLPTGLLKLDGSFVGSIGESPGEEDLVLLSGVIGIAHGLGLTVCAEGVETAEQAARLRELGCDLAQGHHFSRPLTGEAAALLASGT